MPKYQNVDVLPTTKTDSSWGRLKSKLGFGVAAAASSVTVAHAETPNFMAAATTAMEGIGTDLTTFFMGIISIVLIIGAFAITRGGVRKGTSG